MKNIFLNELTNVAPTELDYSMVGIFYYDDAPTELNIPVFQLFYYYIAPTELKNPEGVIS